MSTLGTEVTYPSNPWLIMTGSNPQKTAETRLVETDLKTSNISAAVSDLQTKMGIVINKLNEIIANQGA